MSSIRASAAVGAGRGSLGALDGVLAAAGLGITSLPREQATLKGLSFRLAERALPGPGPRDRQPMTGALIACRW